MKAYTADFETTTDPNDCRVWAWGICSIADPSDFIYGNDIETFLEWCARSEENPKLFFHNLKFDSQFIVSYLLTHDFEYIQDKKDKHDKSFTMLVTDTGAYYSLEIYFKIYKKKVNKVTIQDSLKIFNFSVEEVATAFDLPISKLTLDYTTQRERWHHLTDHEIDYLRNDVEIMARAMQYMYKRNLTKMTIGSNALADYKDSITNFHKYFPVLSPECDADIRRSYKGGFTYLNPIWKDCIASKGIVLDTNSMYPSILRYEEMPFGDPKKFEGKYQFDPSFPLYVQVISCRFEIKKGFIPTIQIKNTMSFIANEYLESSKGELVTLTLTSVDLELFFNHYKVTDIQYGGGYKFKSCTGLFNQYIDYWTEEKIKAGKEGNKALRTIAKLFLNSLYGKFGLSTKALRKHPYLGDDGIVHYSLGDVENRDGIYIPVASFCTSYARKKIIETSMAIRKWSLDKYGEDKYIYSDTDSCHVETPNPEEDIKELAKIIEIDDYKLGAWKPESTFIKGKYLRQKCYIEQDEEGIIHTTIAGLPKKLSHVINFDNFKEGFTTADLTDEEIGESGRKLTYKYVPGGVVLTETDFTIK